MNRRSLVGIVALLATRAALAQSSFVNWETPQVNPLDMTPDGTKLLAVNTADNRLEIYALPTDFGPIHIGSVPVGLDPVTVRARTNTEAWVVNHISDSVSIVDLTTMRVTDTLSPGDEPTDVVFAGTTPKAFVCISQRNQIIVFDPVSHAKVGNPITIEGEDPRALATDGTNIYAAIFESGNQTTILPATVVSSAINPYPNDQNPPPNNGTNFVPAKNPANPAAPAVGLIVKKVAGNWVDDNPSAPGNWNAAVTWNLHDHDVAVINANSLAVSYVTGLMNLDMNLAINPTGSVTVIGTDAINHVRFESNVRGTFVRVIGASFPQGGGTATSIVDLNPHLDYSTSQVDQETRDLSIGDPRGIAWKSDGSLAYITGMGSNNVIAVDGSLNRVANIDVGQGPTGVRIDEARGLVYVLNKFDATISVIQDKSMNVVDTVSMFDPTPDAIRIGRPHLYNTHQTSGLGQASCASCHIDGRMDNIAWDLGVPDGTVKPFDQNCQIGGCENWHPMKGPMTTQTLIGIIGVEPFHWRGDRENLAAFNGAFMNLLGDDTTLTDQEMTDFTNFVATLRFPPQPNRNIDDTLPSTFPNGGNPQTGQTRFQTQPIDAGLITCVTCHALPAGTSGSITPAAALGESQSMKIPQLRNLLEKTGFFKATSSGSPPTNNDNRGFGYIHDGSVDTLFEFLKAPVFIYNGGNADQQRRDIEAFLMCFPSGTHAGVGSQSTVLNGAAIPAGQMARINQMISIANTNAVGLVAKGRLSGLDRGFTYIGSDNFQTDRAAETISKSVLLGSAAPGSELTLTMVPFGTQTRIGIDRDQDGFFDRDELDACSDPADASSIPGPTLCHADIFPAGKPDGVVDVDDLLLVINSWGNTGTPGLLAGDIAPGCGNGVVDVDDLLAIINAWGACP